MHKRYLYNIKDIVYSWDNRRCKGWQIQRVRLLKMYKCLSLQYQLPESRIERSVGIFIIFMTRQFTHKSLNLE